ncbi:unnamed protein product, partial [Onchocerca ochengi]|uniref:RHS repeat protein n=1 Tax=Onchocerca ochengi TaxID=42157 RepID=A0A182EUR9_ONCOC
KSSTVKYDVDGNTIVSPIQTIQPDQTITDDHRVSIRSNSGVRAYDSSGRRQSFPILHSGAIFRNGIIQLLSEGLNPLQEGINEGMFKSWL